jgi:hypothetical protein
MADLIAHLKRLRLYGMAACYAEGLEQGQALLTTAAPLLTQRPNPPGALERSARRTIGCTGLSVAPNSGCDSAHVSARRHGQ